MESQTLSQIKESLKAFSFLTEVPVTFRDGDCNIKWECGNGCKVCRSNTEYYENGSQCLKTLNSAMYVAEKTGDVYIYLCDTGLINLVYAYCENDDVNGYFIAGPIAMGQDRTKVIDKFIGKIPLERIDSTILLSAANKLRLYSPTETRYLMSLFRDAIQSHMNDMPSDSRSKSTEQDFVGSKIIEMKKSHIEIEYPSESERAFIEAMAEGHERILHRRLMKYLEDLMVYDAGDLAVIRIRLIVLFTRLLHERNDLHGEKIFEMENLSHANSLKELTDAAYEFSRFIIKDNSTSMYKGHSEIVNDAMEYIQMNYKENVRLDDIAQRLHVSKSHLSALFSKETGTTILEMVQSARIKSAETLLKTTNQSLTEIAFSCGYESQSYFCKVFKKKHGMTPRQYRNLK